MKLHEVLQEEKVLSGDLWIRPIEFPKGYAYCVYRDELQLVPSPSNERRANLYKIKHLVCNWEIVIPDEVLEEL